VSDPVQAWLHPLSWVTVLLGIISFVVVAVDIARRAPPPMTVMRYVWPINALWAGVFGIWAYWMIGRTGPRSSAPSATMNMGSPEMKAMSAPARPHWQSVATGTLHCGAGCTLADMVGPFVFRALPFTVAGSLVFGEWTLDYILALAAGATFQYGALSPMLGQTGLPVWWRALKVDSLSLSAWQVGMYGWMALVIFVWFGPIAPTHIEFWFLMQLAMACGFCTSYPMNWWLIKLGIKAAM
jgi:hypothetical protein